MSFVKHFVAFSGGLDSTWVMYKLLKEGKCVVPVHVAVGVAVAQSIPEILVKREIIKRLTAMFPGQIVDEQLTRNVSHQLNVIHGIDWSKGTQIPGVEMRDTLIQQLCVRNALANCMMLSDPDQHFYAGWHKLDIESTFSEEIHRRLCDLSDINHITDACFIHNEDDWGYKNPPIIEMPAWDMNKKDMWDDLPSSIQEMIIVGLVGDVEMYGDSEISFTIISDKVLEYSVMGFEVTKHFVMPFPVEDIDILFIHSSITNFDGTFTTALPGIDKFFQYCVDCFKGISQRMNWPDGGQRPWEMRFVHHVGLNQNFKKDARSPVAYPEGRGYVLQQEIVQPGDF